MTRIALVVTATLFFLLGFIANEFRHAKFLDNSNQNIVQPFQHADKISGLKTPQPATQHKTKTSADIEQYSRQKTEVFSWARIDQLMTQENFEEAIKLLKNYKSSQGESS